MEGKGFLKEKTNRIGQKLIAMIILVAMFMVDLAPLAMAGSIVTNNGTYSDYNGSWVTLSSTNKAVLEIIGRAIYQPIKSWFEKEKYIWNNDIVNRFYQPYSTGEYYNIQIPRKFLGSNESIDISSIDFSGTYLGSNYTLPNFSELGGLETIKLHNCSIRNLQPFETAYKNGYFNYIRNIDLGVLNNVELKDQIQNFSLFKDSNINISYTFPAGVDTHLPSTNTSSRYTITYNANGGTGAPASQYKEQGKTIKLSTQKPTKNGFTFTQWATVVGDKIYYYQPGSEFTWDRNMTLTAQWRNNTTGQESTITFDAEPEPEPEPYYYSWSYSGNIYINDYEWENVTKSKTIVFESFAEGEKEAYVPADPDDCWFTLNGAVFTGENGRATREITENGHYEGSVVSPSNTTISTWWADIYNIDNTPPTIEMTKNYPQKTVQEGGTTGVALNITSRDNNGLKSIKVGDNTQEISGTQATSSFFITQDGRYDITVTDLAGNEYTKTTYITVDTNAPEVIDSKIEKVVGIKNGNIADVEVTSGDKLKISLKCSDDDDKGIRSIGAAGGTSEHPIIGKLQLSTGEQIDAAITNSKIEGNNIEFEIDVDKILEIVDPGEYYFRVNGISDWSNNYIAQYTIPTKIIIDNTKPQIHRFEIKGGSKTADGKAVKILPGENLIFELSVTEKLGDKPCIEISDKQFSMEYTKTTTLANNEYYVYSVTVPSDELESVMDGVVPVKITNVKDYAGNTASEKTITDENIANNKVYLHKGVYETESLYIAGEDESVTYNAKGDLNKDGYVSNYDLLLIQRFIQNNNARIYNEEQLQEILKIADIDNDGTLTYEDGFRLSNIVETSRNRIVTEDTDKKFRVLSKDSAENIKDNLSWTFLADGVPLQEGSEDITYNIDANGILSLTLNSEAISKLEIRVERTNSSTEEREFGTLTLYDGKEDLNAGIRIGENNSSELLVRGDANGDGYVTSYDAYCALLLSVGRQTNVWRDECGDYDNDGEVTANDALLMLRKDVNLGVDGFHRIENGTELKLNCGFYISPSDMLEPNKKEYLTWNVIPIVGDSNSFTYVQNDDGSLTLNANGQVGDRAMVQVRVNKVEKPDNDGTTTLKDVDRYSVIYFEIGELGINLNKSDIEYDLSKYEQLDDEAKKQAHEILFAEVNIENKKVDVKSNNENVARIEIDDFGRVEVIPVGVGSTTIDFTCEDVTVSCNVNVIRSITEINTEENVTLKEGETKEITISTNEGTTEKVLFDSEDDKIAKITYDENTGKYKIHGISEGQTTITIYSPSNPEVKRIINVIVEKVAAPRLIAVSASEGYVKAGEDITIEFEFDNAISGTSPDLELTFGGEPSKNSPSFLEFSNDKKKITYSYTVVEGDNGILRIEKLGKGLKDITRKLDAIVTFDNSYYNSEYIEDSDFIDLGIEKGEYINDGIYKLCINTVADTIKPTIVLDTQSSKHWLKNDDMIEVIVISKNYDRLKKAPKVTFNGINANVEKYGEEDSIFKATLKVTDEIEEGFVEIKVYDYEDLAGNEGDEFVARTENIDEPIIIDRTAPSVNLKIYKSRPEGEKYEAGDEIKIELNFIDKTRGGVEYIRADKAPEINLIFGDKKAQGVLTNDYKVENSEEYVTKITYTYKIAEADVGDLKLQSITGLVEDVVGNEANINIVYENGGYYILTKDAIENDTETFVVTYDANGGTNAPSKQTKEKGKDLTLSKDIPSRTGYVFKGWATTKTSTKVEYESGSKYTNDSDITLYAVWEESNSGDDNKDPEVKPGDDNKDPEVKPGDDNKDPETKPGDDSKDSEAKTEDGTKTTNNNNSSNGKVESYNGSLPYTGIQTAGIMFIGLVLFDIGIAVYFINRKRNM